MRHLFLSGLLLAALAGHAQTFSSPESVAYDGARRRWLVSQNGANRIDAYRPGAGGLTSFATGIASGPHGLEVLGDTLYACDGGRIRGFALASGVGVFNVNLGGSFLNGLTTDGVRYLFATDFSTRRVYRVDTRTGRFNIMVTTARTPNGIAYDGANNRLVMVTWGTNAPVQAISLADSTVSTLRTTSLSNCDGITRDPAGNWYVTAWGTNALHRFNAAFSAAPVQVMSGLSSPADIEANTAGDSIAIPNSGGANNVVFFTGTITGVASLTPALQPLRCWPNPAADHCTVQAEPPGPGATLVLFDAAGRLVRRQPLTGARTVVARGGLAAGFYRLVLYDAGQRLRAVQKIAFAE